MRTDARSGVWRGGYYVGYVSSASEPALHLCDALLYTECTISSLFHDDKI